MMIPIRCYTCGKVLAHFYDDYIEGLKAGRDSKELLDSFDLTRYCCRRMLITHVELIDDILTFSTPTR
ncbi:MAG: DNA-directed RNA polymerase subunit N [Candidatus Heimdallarchaeota archaeon]|nr:MAG: DNA-directed RNA polymerase subunit N [Candidatus Heimdallarchaeota archaeon]